jgi:predicted RNA-binding protein
MSSAADLSLVKKEIVRFNPSLLPKLRKHATISYMLPFQDIHIHQLSNVRANSDISLFIPCSQQKPYSESKSYKSNKKVYDHARELGVSIFVQTAMTVSHIEYDRYFPLAHYDISDEVGTEDLTEAEFAAERQRTIRAYQFMRLLGFNHAVVLVRPTQKKVLEMHRYLRSLNKHKLYEVPSIGTMETLAAKKNTMAMTLALLTVNEVKEELSRIVTNIYYGWDQPETVSPPEAYYKSLIRCARLGRT